MQMTHRLCFHRAWPAHAQDPSRQYLSGVPITAHGHVEKLTMRGAIKDASVSRFSGGGPPREGPMITSVSPETTSLTVPRNHPVAIRATIAFQIE